VLVVTIVEYEVDKSTKKQNKFILLKINIFSENNKKESGIIFKRCVLYYAFSYIKSWIFK
jgi:hypothetical protein